MYIQGIIYKGFIFQAFVCSAGLKNMADSEDVVEPLHLDLEDREVYLAKIPVRRWAIETGWAGSQRRCAFDERSVGVR